LIARRVDPRGVGSGGHRHPRGPAVAASLWTRPEW
jgi:hypothetical protein